jgi:hypothetical protein
MNINTVMNNFSEFLNSSWAFIDVFHKPDEIINETMDDWLQANWEILVERKVCNPNEFLEVYGDGADCNGTNSRVTYFDKLPTHVVKVRQKNNSLFEYYSGEYIDQSDNSYIFKQFIGKREAKFSINPPFDFVEVLNDEQTGTLCFHKNDVDFFIDASEFLIK